MAVRGVDGRGVGADRRPQTPWQRGRAPAVFDADADRGRNGVERSFAPAKHWRGPATRYDQLAITYSAAFALRACFTWLRT